MSKSERKNLYAIVNSTYNVSNADCDKIEINNLEVKNAETKSNKVEDKLDETGVVNKSYICDDTLENKF